MREVVDCVELHGLLRRLLAASVLGAPGGQSEDEPGDPPEDEPGDPPVPVLLPLLDFGSMERNGTGLLNFGALDRIAMAVQERHSGMHQFKTSDAFRAFLRATCTRNDMRTLDLSTETLEKLGSPTVEVALIEYQYWRDTIGGTLVPRHGANVITSIATAGSGEEGEWNVFFDVVDPGLRRSLTGPSDGAHRTPPRTPA